MRQWLPGLIGMLLCLAIGAAACGQGPEVRLDDAGNPIAPNEILPTGPLTDLPACGDPLPDAIAANVPGLFLPDGAVVTEVEVLGQITTVMGWIGQTPSQMRRGYRAREDLEILFIEDDTYDAEVLVSDQIHRMYLTVVAQCQDQSRWAATVTTEEVADGEVPVPLPGDTP